jgi:nucleoside-diphosphate-sugar epimerase
MKRVLVTGATGFIGACVVRRLIREHSEVHVIMRKQSNKWRIRDLAPHSLVQHVADLRDKERITSIVRKVRPNVVYHLAAYGAYHFQRDPDEIIATNITGALNLLNACSKVGTGHFIAAGSSSEYGIKNHPMKETDTLEPVDLYGIAKAAATLVCGLFARVHDMPVTVFRPFAVYGYYEEPTRLIPTVIRSCLGGETLRLLSSSSVRDFIFVDDVIDALLRIESVGKKSSDQIYNIGSGKQYTVSHVVSKIIELTGAEIQPLWGRAEKREKKEPRMWVSNISKARRELGWQPKHDLEDGLTKTITWFRKNLALYES